MRTYLPEFAVADPEVSRAVTLRHLLSHTSGIDGDNFADFGRGDDCLERYVESCATLEQTHPLGATMSYCNTGFSILGRIIEVVTGKVWDAAMRERLFEPLGLTHTGTLPEEALLHRAAVGHVKPSPDASLEVAPVWMLPRSCGPMGLINSTVADVLTFARLHLDAGKAQDGTQLVSAEGIAAMQQPQVESPDHHTLGSPLGTRRHPLRLGRARRLRPRRRHDRPVVTAAHRARRRPGDHPGRQRRRDPAGVPGDLRRADGRAGRHRHAPAPGGCRPSHPTSTWRASPVPIERLSVRYDLTPEDGRLVGTVTLSGPIAALTPDPGDEGDAHAGRRRRRSSSQDEESTTPAPAVFYEFRDGVPQYLHHGARANPRVTVAAADDGCAGRWRPEIAKAG